MRALIFGSNGQDGNYLRKLLQQEKVDVIGISRHNAEIIGAVEDFATVKRVINTYSPDYIFHFAANSTTKHDALWDNHLAISTGTLNILESAYLYSPKSKIFLSGSGLQFENLGEPISEDAPFATTSPYVVSRNHSVHAARYYRKMGLNVYIGYFFNHDSPLRSTRHISQKIASYCRYLDEQQEKLIIGNIDVGKEWTFAGDVVAAVWQLVNNNKMVYEAVIGCGTAYTIEDWLNICFELINRNWKEHVVIDDDFVSEYEVLVSNPSTILSLGWQPKVSIEELAKMMIFNENEV